MTSSFICNPAIPGSFSVQICLARLHHPAPSVADSQGAWQLSDFA
ncbi:MAG: hypothetical protein Q4B94_09750 [Pseudomonadota bacterium]|nr:hypothetical protein [Pseudomonadota bacterium]